MIALETTPAFVRTPRRGWESWQRQTMAVAMGAEIVSLFDQLLDGLRLVMSDEAYDAVAPLVECLRDRGHDIVDDMKGRVQW